MLIDIGKIKDRDLVLEHTYSGKDLTLEEADIKLVGKLNAHIVVSKKRRTLTLRIHSEYALYLTCSRCLTEFKDSFVEENEYFLERGSEILEEEKELEEEDALRIYYETEELDITPFVREGVILSVPMKPLCKEDCKGLCPVCGVNLNHTSCNHKEEDTRQPKGLQILKELIEKGQ